MPALATSSGHEPGLYELLAALPSQLKPHVSTPEDRTFLLDMFGERSLHSLFKIHERLQHYEEDTPAPVLDTAGTLAHDLSEELKGKTATEEIRELLKLLARPHVQSLLSVHDTVALKKYEPELPPLPEDMDHDEESVKIIRLVKNKEPLGATIKRDEHTGAILVARIMRGGAADRSGLIHVGDELKEVNGIPVDDKKPEEIIRILAQSQGAITFKVIPSAKEDVASREPKMFVKALFDYDPGEDKAIPCKEAGLAFKKDSVLQIMSQEDATWWQAKYEGDANPRAGLVPSKHFQERRFALQRPAAPLQLQRTPTRRSLAADVHKACITYSVSLDDVEVEFANPIGISAGSHGHTFDSSPDTGEGTSHKEDADNSSGFQLAGFRRSFRLSRRNKKTNKSMYECKKSELYDTADVPTYEEVAPYCRQSGSKHRLVVFVGPTGVGLNELKRKLLISDPQHFSVTVPHTTRAKKSQESDGVEYHFISKHLFETDIHNNKFIEYGEYKGNYYGTSLDSVRSVLAKNKVCLLDVQPHTIKHLRTAEFKPYIVFVKPPTIERLRETRKNGKVISGKDDRGNTKPFMEEDFQEMVNTARIMEGQYGHLFEKVIVNDDLVAAFGELRQALRRVETETHWLPISWTHS